MLLCSIQKFEKKIDFSDREDYNGRSITDDSADTAEYMSRMTTIVRECCG